MTKTLFYTIAFLLTGISFSSFGQHSYFFNQKNVFSVRTNFNPRLIPIRQNDSNDGMGGAEEGVGRGTYYQYYDESNNLVGGHQKVNVMLNTSYKRLFGGNKFFGVEFNYQKHNFTMNENANMGYKE